jgi:hypothetical protein
MAVGHELLGGRCWLLVTSATLEARMPPPSPQGRREQQPAGCDPLRLSFGGRRQRRGPGRGGNAAGAEGARFGWSLAWADWFIA